MPFSDYDTYFGGKGGGAKAHRAMVAQYGKRGDAVFYSKVNKMKAARKRKRKSTSEAIEAVRTALATVPTTAEVMAAMGAVTLLENLYLQGFTAVQDGDLSFEAVTAAVQQAVTKYAQDYAAQHPAEPYVGPCVVVATFMGSAVYEECGKFYQVEYSMEGTEASVTSEPTEVAAEFMPTPALQESRDTPLIEAHPASPLAQGRLKRDLNIIEGTVLITSVSANGAGKGGRRYSEQALKQIAAMSEGLPAYLNHVSNDQAFKPRDLKDLIGIHRNIRYFPTEGKIISDLHIAEHQAPLVFSLADKFGDHIGNSLVSRGLVTMEGDTEIVKEIAAVRSADLVSDPATTRGLFESRSGDPDPFGTLINELRESLTAPHKEDIMDLAAILSFLKDKPSDQKLLAEHFGFVPKPDAEKLQEQVATLTVDRDKAAKLAVELESARAKSLADLQEAQVALDAHKAKDALAEKRAKILTVIESHDLGKQFGKVKEAVTDRFKSLLEQTEESEWSGILDDRFKALKGVPGAAPSSQGKPDSLMQEHQQDGPLPEGIEARLAAAL